MNRFLSILLSALLLAGLCVPAMAAAESADARLERVTQAVKDTLALDTGAFTDFRGDVYEQELGTVWTLNWSGGGTTLSVRALEDGTVLNYSRSDSDADVYSVGDGLPTLPKVDVKAAKSAAETFLARVLDAKTESVALGEPVSASRLGSSVCRFSGAILLNGLPSPLGYSISVRGGDHAVTSFYRDALATSFLGSIPPASPAVSNADAAKALKSTLNLELVYVRDETDEQTAVLRYVPKDADIFYVDAQTGKLVTPDDDIGYANDAAAPSAGAAEDEGAASRKELSQAELDGIQKLEGVLDSAALDKHVRAETAYKLNGYTLASANYRLVKDGESETVLCTIRYAAAEDEDGFASSRTFTVDARSGAVKALYSSARWDKARKSAISPDSARKTAEAFLTRFSAHAGEFAFYDAADNTSDGAPFYGFTFARKANGIFFPGNSCTIQIDRMTGAVAGVGYTYDETVKFDAKEGLISADAALDAWMASFDVTLAYRALPKELSRSDPAEAKLLDLGYTRFRTLFLSYALEREDYFSGVDAKTGKLAALPVWKNEITYGDVAGHWAAAEIELLARYGVGYAGEAFQPDKALTQWELVALLVSTRGLRFDPDNATAEEKDSAYENAYRMGALTRGERNDASPVTRAALVRCLLNAAGYGPVAKLPGIFTCSYGDRASIPADGLGYAALAQGFGLVSGERYNGEGAATRAIAAVMLCRLMERAG